MLEYKTRSIIVFNAGKSDEVSVAQLLNVLLHGNMSVGMCERKGSLSLYRSSVHGLLSDHLLVFLYS